MSPEEDGGKAENVRRTCMGFGLSAVGVETSGSAILEAIRRDWLTARKLIFEFKNRDRADIPYLANKSLKAKAEYVAHRANAVDN